jgi:hypothetical protein
MTIFYQRTGPGDTLLKKKECMQLRIIYKSFIIGGDEVLAWLN